MDNSNYEVKDFNAIFNNELTKVHLSITVYYPKTKDTVKYEKEMTTDDYIRILSGTYGKK
jgi:hypothetical protein